MPARKQPPSPPWQVILEEIRSQNRLTIEAVETSRASLEERINRLEQESRSRGSMLEMAIRELRLTVQQLQGDVKSVQGDVHILTAKVEALAHLDERVAALEKRFA